MERILLLQNWIAAQFPGKAFDLQPASEDASFRRYFRVSFADGTLIAMDAPPAHEDCRPFIKVAELLLAAGVHVPRVLKSDLQLGFLLLDDLGRATYLQALNADNAHAFYLDAINALIKIQLASRAGVLPDYDAALLMREMRLFPDWYAARHLQAELNAAQTETLNQAFERVLANNLAQPKVYVHRDYH
ncbi:MAG: aminoglycoside phosphotransferase family protein, partial [Burkholderiales bacterium]